jgi:uncharacterized protein (DUF736 family)
MRIGTAKQDPETNRITATITAPGLVAFEVELFKIKEPQNRQPDWEIRYYGERCGALWKRTGRGENAVEFLSGPLESPIFPGGKIEIAVWKAKEPGRKGELDITWNPPRVDRQESAPAANSSGSTPSAAGGAGEDDDDIPF